MAPSSFISAPWFRIRVVECCLFDSFDQLLVKMQIATFFCISLQFEKMQEIKISGAPQFSYL